MTAVFDTHPPLIYVTISSVKKIGFETGTHPPFMSMSQNTQFFMASLRGIPSKYRIFHDIVSITLDT